MTKAKKIGKDVIDKKATGILRTARERAEYEEWKRQRELTKQEKDEEKEQELHGKKIVSKMIEEKEPKPEGLTPEEFAQMKALAKQKKLKVKKIVLKEEEE